MASSTKRPRPGKRPHDAARDEAVKEIVEAMLLGRWPYGAIKEFAKSHNLTVYRARVYAAEAARHIRLLEQWPVEVR